jgi:hypothetical protein
MKTKTTYESDGSDGYAPGTWGCCVAAVVDGDVYESRSSGWPSEELAREWGNAQ